MGLKHIGKLLKSPIHWVRHGNIGIRRFRCEKSSVVEPCVESRNRSKWTVKVFESCIQSWVLITLDSTLDVDADLRHAPLIISDSECNANTKTASAPREKLQGKLVLDGRRSPILKRDEATRYRSACMRLSYLAQDRLDLAETAKHLAQRMSEPREFDFVPFETCSANSSRTKTQHFQNSTCAEALPGSPTTRP